MDKIIERALYVIRKDKQEWEKRYDEYANLFIKNKESISKLSKTLKEYSPLLFYISTSKVKKAKTSLILDLRYRGQSIATLTTKHNGVTISTKDKEEINKRDFECTIKLPNNTDWKSEEARAFRKFFKDRENSRSQDGKGNEEHNVEQLLLTEFSKKSGKLKPIKGIQPVKICGKRFAMPTPISASNHKAPLKYSGQRGGSIDILARTGLGRNYPTVIEVKDVNKATEPPIYALQQAIQYAVFIRELLRSERCGRKWYEVFGFEGNIPKKLTIRVACAMPDDYLDKSFAQKEYDIDNDLIECHYIYFKYDKKKLSDFQTSLKQ